MSPRGRKGERGKSHRKFGTFRLGGTLIMAIDFTFACPQCGATLHGKDEWVGKTASCKKCQHRLIVPPQPLPTQHAQLQTPRVEAPPSPPPRPQCVPTVPPQEPHRAAPPPFHAETQAANDFLVDGGGSERTSSTAVQVNVIASRPSNSLGIGSIVLAVVGLFTLCLPFVAMPLLLLGLALGIAGIVVAIKRKGGGIGLPIAGSAICGILLIPPMVTLLAAGAFVGAVNEAANGQRTQS